MDEGGEAVDQKLALERLALERLKIKLDHRKFVLGSVFAAITIAAIPPLFQLATAVLEYAKSQHEQQIREEQFHESYVTSFLTNALTQDIELRIRLADYFQYVSTDRFRKGWIDYHGALVTHRDEIRVLIDKLEGEWSKHAQERGASNAALVEIERHLAWAYNEVGYAAKDRSAVIDPRAPARDSAPTAGSWVGVQFASLVQDGFFSSDPGRQDVPLAIKANNPAALNISAWQTKRPGFVGALPRDAFGNQVVIYRTPEHGIASWYYLLRSVYGYGQAHKFTLVDLARKYAGGGAPQATIDRYVSSWKAGIQDGLGEFDIDNDAQMVALSKAVFRNEVGVKVPWLDSQILYGVKGEREHTLPP